MKKNNKAEMGELIRIILWVVFLIIVLGGGVYYILTRFGAG